MFELSNTKFYLSKRSIQWIALVFCIGVAFPSIAKNIDSLRSVLDVKPPQEQVDLLLEMASLQAIANGIKDTRSALDLARKIGYTEGEITALHRIATYHVYNFETKKAIAKYEESKQLIETLKGENYKFQLKNNSGLIDANLIDRNYSKALEYALFNFDLARKHHDLIEEAYAHLQQSRIYETLFNFDLAYNHSIAALRLFEQANENSRIGYVYVLLTELFVNQSQMDSAWHYSEKVWSTIDEFPLSFRSSREPSIRALRAHLLLHRKAYEVAFKLLQINEQTLNVEEYPYDYMLTVLELGKYYFFKQEEEKAIDYLKQVEQISETINVDLLLKEAFYYLKKIYQQRKDWDAFIEIDEKYQACLDQMNKESHDSEILGLQIKFELEEKNKKLELSEKNVELQKSVRNILLVIAVILLLLFYLLYHRFRLKKEVMENQVAILKSQEEKKHLELEHIKVMQSLEVLESQRLKEKLEQKERILVTKTIHINQKNKVLEEIRASIQPLVKEIAPARRKKLQAITKIVDGNIDQQDYWKSFHTHFEEVHPLFFERLQKRYPNLNKNDHRLCAYLKMNLSNKEIAQLLSIDVASVGKNRYRIRKKMSLEKEEPLDQIIATL